MADSKVAEISPKSKSRFNESSNSTSASASAANSSNNNNNFTFDSPNRFSRNDGHLIESFTFVSTELVNHRLSLLRPIKKFVVGRNSVNNSTNYEIENFCHLSRMYRSRKFQNPQYFFNLLTKQDFSRMALGILTYHTSSVNRYDPAKNFICQHVIVSSPILNIGPIIERILSKIHLFIVDQDLDSLGELIKYSMEFRSSSPLMNFQIHQIDVKFQPSLEQICCNELQFILFHKFVALPNILSLLMCILLEQRLIIVSSNPLQLSIVSICLYMCIKPFRLLSTFIPLLPVNLMKIVESPMPYIIGIIQESFSSIKSHKYDNSFVFDVATDNFLQRPKDLPKFPTEINKSFSSFIKKIVDKNVEIELNFLISQNKMKESLRRNNFSLERAYFLFMTYLMKCIPKSIRIVRIMPKPVKLFMERMFRDFSAQSSSESNFYESLIDTSHFKHLVDNFVQLKPKHEKMIKRLKIMNDIEIFDFDFQMTLWDDMISNNCFEIQSHFDKDEKLINHRNFSPLDFEKLRIIIKEKRIDENKSTIVVNSRFENREKFIAPRRQQKQMFLQTISSLFDQIKSRNLEILNPISNQIRSKLCDPKLLWYFSLNLFIHFEDSQIISKEIFICLQCLIKKALKINYYSVQSILVNYHLLMACNNICTTIDSQKWRMLDFLEDFRFLRCSKFWIDSILYSVESQLIRTYMKDSSDSNNSMNCYYNIKLEEFSRLSKIRNSTDLKESNKFGELDDEILLMELIHFAFFICEISLPSFILANRPKSLAKFENDSEQQASTPGSRNSFPNEDLQQQCDSTAKIIEDFQIWATSIFAKVLKIIEFTNNAREKFFGAFRDCIDSLDVSNSSTIANQSHNHRFDPLYDSQQFVIYDKEESLLHLKCSSKVKEKGSSLSLSGVITITNIRLVFNGIINERFNKVETSILFTEILNHKQKKTSGKANLWILTANFVNYDLHISGSHREITKFSHLFIKNLNNARLLNINAENRQLWSRYIYLPTISKSALKKSPFIAIENSKKHLNIPNYPNEIYVPKSLSSSECLRKIMKLFNNKALPILLSTNIYSNSSFFRSGELNGILDPNNLSLNEIINFFALLANEEIPKIQQLSEEPKGILKIKRLTRAFSVNSNRNKLNSSHQYISYSSVSSSFDLNEEPKALVICSVKNAQTLRNLAKQFSIGFINFEDSANLLPSIKFYHSTQFFLNFNQLSSSILRTVNFLVYSNHLKSLNILTMLKASSHSTNIINSLLDLCLNAKYRTIQGFVQLVFHNWLVFENKATKVAEIGDFRTRLSISFIQFLFCVFQISISYPKLFEFNSHLIDIFAFHHLSDFFADFCLGESITNYSIMNYLISPTNSHDNSPNKFYQLFVNNSYESCSESNQEAIIIPCVDRHSFRPWPHFLHPLNSFQPTPLQLLKVATKTTTTTTIDNSYSSSLDLSQFSNLIVAQPMAIEQVNSEEDVKDYNAFLQLSIPLSSHFKLKSFSSGSNHIFENIEIDYFQFNSCSVCLEPVVCKLDDGLSCSMCTMIIHLRCNDERFMEDLRYCSPNLGTLKSLSSKKSNPALQTNNLSASSQNANSIAPNNCRLYVEDSNKQNVTLEIDIIHDQLKIIRPRNTKFLPFRSIKDVNFINNSSSKLIELKFVERSKQVFKILDDANYTLWFSLIKFKI